MATKDFLLPDLGEGLTEGEIVQWLVQEGDTIGVDQPVAEIETAKAVVEVPSPWAGTVVTLHAQVGQEVEVGKPLLTIEVVDAPVQGPAQEASPADAQSVPHGVHGGSSEEGEVSDLLPQPGDEPRGTIDSEQGSGNVLVGYGTGGEGRTRRRRGAARSTPPGASPARPPAAPSRPPLREGRPLAKPPVRKLAKDLGIDLTRVPPSGPGGVVTREDVERYARGNGQPSAQPAVSVTDSEHRPLPSAPPNEVAFAQPQRIPVRGVRKAIAEKMTRSRREIPEATTWVDCDATGLWELRQALDAEQTETKVTPLALILRCVVAALRKFPEVNASLDTDRQEIVRHRHVNLGFAAQTDRGLIVPVIKDAHLRSTLEIAAELNRLAKAARDGKVTPEELVGGTFTVSNYGSFGVDGGSAVINFPEAAILGVGRIADRPWVVNGEIAVRKVLQLSIAFDHRVCDGGEAAGFLRFLADLVESPTKLLGAL